MGELMRRYWRSGTTVVHHTNVGFSVFEHGIPKRRLLEGKTEETSPSWRIGHPVLFPNYEHGSGGG